MKNKKGIDNIKIRHKTSGNGLHNESGVTLIALVTTIIIIMILMSITIYTGVEIYENMKVENFVAKMIVVQEAVDKLCEKYTVSEINDMANSAPDETVLKQIISQGKNNELNCWYNVDDIQANYKYFDINSINTILGIKDFDTAIWLNPISRNVIASKGVEYEEKMYYRQYDLPGGQTLPTPNVNMDFSLKYLVKTYDNKAEIILYKSVGTENVETIFSQVKLYEQKEGTTEYGDAKIFNNVSRITLTESGVYKVEATDLTKNTQSQENISVTIVNEPLLVDGMVPVKFIDTDGDGINETMTETTVEDEDWYNYGENTKQWANAKLKDGSLYIWIPRFAYEIDSDKKEINITFLKEVSQIGTDGKAITSTYKVAPAFQDGTQNNFTNGEWNNNISGFWVAKYETTENDSKPQNILIDKQAWRNINPTDAFDICRKMESEYKSTYFGNKVSAASGVYIFGKYKTDQNNIDTHLMKNSEWGAVAYLTHSKYGCGASNVAKASSYYIKNSDNEGCSAPEYSSTNNYTGIYGLNGGANEIVAAGVDVTNYDNFENISNKYATIYTTEEITSTKNIIYGDAMSKTSGWNGNDAAKIITEVIARGGDGKVVGENNTGIFAYYDKHERGEESSTFRPVLIIEYESDNSDFIEPPALADKITAANYGDYVNYEVDLGIKTAGMQLADRSEPKTDWRIFYKDSNNVFLIASDNLPINKFPSGVFANTSGSTGWWKTSSIDTNLLTTSGTVTTNKSFLFDKLEKVTKTNKNYQAATTLLDTTKWTAFAKEGYVDDVNTSIIGSPTVEMWMKSWNDKYKDTLAFDSNEIGYKIGLTEDNLSDSIGYSDIHNKKGYSDTLYFSHLEHKDAAGYWLASPSAYDQDVYGNYAYYLLIVHYNCLSNNRLNWNFYGVRPVVCLKAGIEAKQDENGVWQLVEPTAERTKLIKTYKVRKKDRNLNNNRFLSF